MTPFSDDDLKKLKDYLANSPLKHLPIVTNDLALIARLEASEALEPYWKYYEPVSIEDEKEYNAKVESWRKACGGE